MTSNPMKWIAPLMVVFFFMQGCAGAQRRERINLERPDSDICVVNALAMNKKCYNLKADFLYDGRRKVTAKAIYHPVDGIMGLDKNVCMDPLSFERLKAAWLLMRALENE